MPLWTHIKMIKITNIKLPIEYTEDDLIQKIIKTLRLRDKTDIVNLEVVRRSIDARDKSNILYVFTINVTLNSSLEKRIVSGKKNKNITASDEVMYRTCASKCTFDSRPVVIGLGPAGLFCALELAKAGANPICIERGKSVEERQKDVDKFWLTGVLDTESNVQFGEGGAGAFSDGKLNTMIKDPKGYGRYVLRTFVEHGAKADIMYDAKPHVGTDVLSKVIASIRDKIKSLGGDILYNTKVTDFIVEASKITGAVLSDGRVLETNKICLAIGHSARDTFEMLYNKNIPMEPKSFAVGFRVEHPQSLINISQYGNNAYRLPASPYKVTYNRDGDRSVYSFCMCPGGYVVNASSEEGLLTVNGMSYSKRDSSNANSAIVIAVNPSDYPDDTALSGVAFQRSIEKKAYGIGNGLIPQQLLCDFIDNRESTCYGEFASLTKGGTSFSNLREILTNDMNESFIHAFDYYGRHIDGFNRPDVILSGIEARTSSPLRIMRDESLQSIVRGLYPCGEGAGFAGGITSAAIDGIKVANAMLKLGD